MPKWVVHHRAHRGETLQFRWLLFIEGRKLAISERWHQMRRAEGNP